MQKRPFRTSSFVDLHFWVWNPGSIAEAPGNIWSCCGCIFAILSHQKPFFSEQSEGVYPKSLTLFVEFVSRIRCQSTTQFLCFFMKLCGPGTEILEPMLAFVHDRRVTSTNVLLHPHLRDARPASFTACYDAAQLFLLHWRVRSLQCSLSSTVTHLQSLATGLCPASLLLMLLHNFSYFTDELDNFSVRFRPL